MLTPLRCCFTCEVSWCHAIQRVCIPSLAAWTKLPEQQALTAQLFCLISTDCSCLPEGSWRRSRPTTAPTLSAWHHALSVMSVSETSILCRSLLAPVVRGAENVPDGAVKERGCLFVGNHTQFGMYDLPFLMYELYLRGHKVRLSRHNPAPAPASHTSHTHALEAQNSTLLPAGVQGVRPSQSLLKSTTVLRLLACRPLHKRCAWLHVWGMCRCGAWRTRSTGRGRRGRSSTASGLSRPRPWPRTSCCARASRCCCSRAAAERRVLSAPCPSIPSFLARIHIYPYCHAKVLQAQPSMWAQIRGLSDCQEAEMQVEQCREGLLSSYTLQVQSFTQGHGMTGLGPFAGE